MLLEAERKVPVEHAQAADVRAVIRKLRSYGPSSYASLTDEHGSYLQVAGGGITCLLEWRDAVKQRHYRAYLDAPSPIFPNGTMLVFSGGKVKLQSDEWLTEKLVEEAFIAFLDRTPLPMSIRWRDITAMFKDLV